MFSKEQSKEIRQQFWIFFGKRYPRKWLLYHTGIKDVALKFDFDTKKAIVAIESAATDDIDRAYYFDKLICLKNLLLEDVSSELNFEEDYLLPSGKIVSRCYLQLENVSIHNKNTWPEVFDFFNTYMSKAEEFFLEYKEYIES